MPKFGKLEWNVLLSAFFVVGFMFGPRHLDRQTWLAISAFCLIYGGIWFGYWMAMRRAFIEQGARMDFTREHKLKEVERLSDELIESFSDGLDETSYQIRNSLYSMSVRARFQYETKKRESENNS